MSKTAAKTADFLKAMQTTVDEPPAAPAPQPAAASAATPAMPIVPAAAPKPANSQAKRKASRAKVTTARDGLKHFGGYLDDETMEKIALLRIRLKLDNSELIARAIDELAKKHSAARKFGDA